MATQSDEAMVPRATGRGSAFKEGRGVFIQTHAAERRGLLYGSCDVKPNVCTLKLTGSRTCLKTLRIKTKFINQINIK